MHRYSIARDSSADDLESVLMAFHTILSGLPVTGRSKDKPGLRIEGGKAVDRAYTGPVLEEVLVKNQLVKTRPAEGAYKGIPVVVAPVRDLDGDVIGAIGVVDITGIFDLATLMEHQSFILRQVCGTDPCPIDTEQIMAKR
ncbi:MAG: DUF2111 domain-containing protein [Methanocalculus sp. MSAO_Arc1]|uniref:DUF2111 domain-containing protein n=1 Tax=Methanocalculus TaxID=71151 RepID=UPI000FEDC7A0|nr:MULTISPECIES: DUF2111 domain-containing protein [unclassified Methanocalculus]MCP1661724.1 hypothetical protein [Methanocalculus sp. AMF5]RQD79402.1 MAG: DUF2111 domain-containing protein [Methanocalculus sp. MSAO_Arc1]